MSKKPSLADVARMLGVSKTLVSLVINNKGDIHGISSATQKKVRDKIQELNYQPNALARGFRTGKTHTIGLIVSDISNRFYSRIARNIEDYAWSKGYTVIICSTDENVEKEKKQINMLLDKKTDGLIVSSSQNDADFFHTISGSGMPLVLIDRTFGSGDLPSVSVDNYGGGRLAALHMLKQGIRKAGVIGIYPEHISTINERIRGFESTMAEAGVSIPTHWQIRAPFESSEQVINESLQKLHNDGNLPEAIFTLNNNLTSTTLQQLHGMEVKIPEDITLLGFDDVLYYGFTRPTITAIEQPVDLISEKAFELLMKQIQKTDIDPSERSVILPVNLIIRESSVKPLHL
jgi:LacI family transcriptional regulator